jgi:hypothetical protein
MTMIGMGKAFNVKASATALFFRGKGVGDALLHYASIQSRDKGNRVVRRQQVPMVDRSQAAKAI